MRQYLILYKRGWSEYGRLKPVIDAARYGRDEVKEAVEYMRTHPHIEGIAVRVGDEMFNVISFNQEAAAPDSFVFDSLTINEPIDSMSMLRKAGLEAAHG